MESVQAVVFFTLFSIISVWVYILLWSLMYSTTFPKYPHYFILNPSTFSWKYSDFSGDKYSVYARWNLDSLRINFPLIVDKRMLSKKKKKRWRRSILKTHFPSNYVLFDPNNWGHDCSHSFLHVPRQTLWSWTLVCLFSSPKGWQHGILEEAWVCGSDKIAVIPY